MAERPPIGFAEPCKICAVVTPPAKLLKIDKLSSVSISQFKNKMIKEFYKDSKKVSNKNMKKILKLKLKYPTYKEGLRNIFNNSI